MNFFQAFFVFSMLFFCSVYAREQKNVLIEAVKKGDKALVEKLIKQGADVNVNTGYEMHLGETALMFAAQQGNIEIMKQLIKAGADVNAVAWNEQPHAGNPVVRYAIDNGSLQAVNLLLEAGADPNAGTESPVIVEKKGGSKANVRNINLLSHAINTHASIDIIKTLIDHGAYINTAEGKMPRLTYWTPLMIATFRGYEQAVQALLDAGANVNVVNKSDSNKTVLDYAREGGFSNIVKMLQEHHFKAAKSCKVK